MTSKIDFCGIVIIAMMLCVVVAFSVAVHFCAAVVVNLIKLLLQ